jgi:gamma-glutamylcyclotransferase (GGCT)/AIG2-like uncharacterized protein YtfP
MGFFVLEKFFIMEISINMGKSMIFQHDKFQIDLGSQIVYDKFGDELRIYGKEYLILAKLCEDKAASHLELAQILGFGELYRGRELVEYMQRINAKVKGEVVVYDGKNYKLIGEIKEVEQVEHAEKPQPEPEEQQEKIIVPVFNKPLSFVIFVGIFIIIAVWFIKFLLDQLL